MSKDYRVDKRADTAMIVAFLRARYAEDTATADAAVWDGYTWVPKPCHVARADTDVCVTEYPSDAEHIARWDPPRVLAELDANEQVLGLLLADCDDPRNAVRRVWAWEILRLYAVAYRGHPDYLREWAL